MGTGRIAFGMAANEEIRPPWRIRRPGSTGLLVIAFVAVFLLWLQVHPAGVGEPPPAPSVTATTMVLNPAPLEVTPAVTTVSRSPG